MRITAQLELKSPQFPRDHRRACMSQLKTGLTDYSGGEFFRKLYDGSAKAKPLCFAVGFPRGIRFEKDRIVLPERSNQVYITYSTGDMETGILLYNALKRVKGKSRPLANGNEMTLKRLYMPPEACISGTQMLVKTLSPICVRLRDGGQKQYCSVERPDFEEKLREQLMRRFQNSNSITDEMLKTFHFLPIQMKKTVVLHFGQKIECSIGTAAISGAPELLFELYENGLGSRCSNGFGLLQILQQR